MKKCGPTQTPEDVDLTSLREKYRYEADRRRRPERTGQYRPTAGDLVDFYETDPYSPRVARSPESEQTDVAIIGGGFAGLIVSTRLKQAGVGKIRIIEMGGDFGGTWYWNRYPGAQCDVESHIYIPLLEELKYTPKDKYAYGPEIYNVCQRIGRHFGLYEQALFGTIVRTIRWDGEASRWRITTNRGDDIRARFLVMAAGFVNKPKLPGVPGIEHFKGHSFHTCRWDYEYTGGDATGGLVKLGDKRVAVIGTGASAVQVVPHLGRDAKHLYVFQRTPPPVSERANEPTDPSWAKSLKPGWQAERQRNFQVCAIERLVDSATGRVNLGIEDAVCDGWTEINRNVQARVAAMGNPPISLEQYLQMREVEDYRAMERLRRRVDSVVTDKKTAEALKPWYRFYCKRPCFSDDYLATFSRPNVTLVDVSASKGVERITEKGIVANGIEHEVDCIIYASGFDITDDLKRRFAIDAIEGRNKVSLYEHWRDGYRTLHGLTTHSFPNFFFVGYSQGGLHGSVAAGYEDQAKHIAYIVTETMARGAATVEPSQTAQDRWVRTVREKALVDKEFAASCTPSFLNKEGGPVTTNHPVFGEFYGDGYYAFAKVLSEWRNQGDMEGMVLSAFEASDRYAGSL